MWDHVLRILHHVISRDYSFFSGQWSPLDEAVLLHSVAELWCSKPVIAFIRQTGNFRRTSDGLDIMHCRLAQSFIKFVWAPYWAMYPSSTCMCVNLISRSYRTSFSTSNATGWMQCNVNSSCSEILLPTVILFPLCLFCIWSCKCSCIRSAQSRNLCNLKIALHNLRIRKLCANLKFAIHLCNLKMVQCCTYIIALLLSYYSHQL